MTYFWIPVHTDTSPENTHRNTQTPRKPVGNETELRAEAAAAAARSLVKPIVIVCACVCACVSTVQLYYKYANCVLLRHTLLTALKITRGFTRTVEGRLVFLTDLHLPQTQNLKLELHSTIWPDI